MKICYLASSASIHSHKWINYFSDNGHEILWISLDQSSIEIPKKISYYEFNGLYLFNIFKIKSIISEFNPDILHIHYLGHLALIGILSNVDPIVATPWGSDIIEGKKSFFKKIIISKILHKSKAITCDAHHMADEIKNFNISTDKIKIVKFGIDTERFSYKGVQENKLKDYGSDDDLKVISLRDFEPVYDIENLINAIPLVLSKISKVHFVLLGRGTLRDKFKLLVNNLGLANSVSFLDYVDNVDMPYILSSADVLVSTSLSDAGIAGSTAEAMSCKVPVVITNSGENDLWVNHGENGFLVPVSDPQKLAKYIITLLEDKELRIEIGEKARKTILEHNDFFVEMKKMQHIYKKCL